MITSQEYQYQDNVEHLAQLDAPPPYTRTAARREREEGIYLDGLEAAERGEPFANPYCAVTQPRSYTAWGLGFGDAVQVTDCNPI